MASVSGFKVAAPAPTTFQPRERRKRLGCSGPPRERAQASLLTDEDLLESKQVMPASPLINWWDSTLNGWAEENDLETVEASESCEGNQECESERPEEKFRDEGSGLQARGGPKEREYFFRTTEIIRKHGLGNEHTDRNS